MKRLSEGDGIDGVRLNILLEQVEISVELVAKGGIFHGGVGSQRVIFISIEKKKEIVLGHGQKVDHPFGARAAGAIGFEKSGSLGKTGSGNRGGEHHAGGTLQNGEIIGREDATKFFAAYLAGEEQPHRRLAAQERATESMRACVLESTAIGSTCPASTENGMERVWTIFFR